MVALHRKANSDLRPGQIIHCANAWNQYYIRARPLVLSIWAIAIARNWLAALLYLRRKVHVYAASDLCTCSQPCSHRIWDLMTMHSTKAQIHQRSAWVSKRPSAKTACVQLKPTRDLKTNEQIAAFCWQYWTSYVSIFFSCDQISFVFSSFFF